MFPRRAPFDCAQDDTMAARAPLSDDTKHSLLIAMALLLVVFDDFFAADVGDAGILAGITTRAALA